MSEDKVQLGKFSKNPDGNKEFNDSFNNTIKELTAKIIIPSTCLLIYGFEDKLVSFGSGVFYENEKGLYILSAAHVFDEIDKLLIPFKGKLVKLNYEKVISTSLDSTRDNDLVDLSACLLNKEFGKELKESYLFINNNRIELEHDTGNNNSYLVCGYPANRVNIDRRNSRIEVDMFNLLTKINDDFDKHKYSDNYHNHIFTSYPRKVKKLEGDSLMLYNKNPEGISGSGIWTLVQNAQDDILHIEVKLVGINIEHWHKDMSCFISTKIDLLIDVINEVLN